MSYRSLLNTCVLLTAATTLLCASLGLRASDIVLPDGYVAEVFASGLDGPVDAVFGRSGNLYVANEGIPDKTYPGRIVSIITKKGMVSDYLSGFMGPSGLAFDPAGVLYISDDSGPVYVEGTGRSFGPFANPNAIAFDNNGILYVAAVGGQVFRVTDTGVPVPLDIQPPCDPWFPTGLAFDANNNLYVSSISCQDIVRFTPDGDTTVFAHIQIPGSAEGLAFDRVGVLTPPPPPPAPRAPILPRPWRGLFVASPVDGSIYQIDEQGGVVQFAAGFDWPRRLCFSNKGDLYVTEFRTGLIWRISRGR